MSDKPKKGLDRRDLMIASIATVGAAAALAANAGSANAQDTATPSADRIRRLRERSIPAM